MLREGRLIICSGYKVEIVSAGSELEKSARDFLAVKTLLRDSRINGQDRISVVRARDVLEIFVGDVWRARLQYGL